MTQTLFFYDLETSGLSPRQDRIMQFAGQRTDMELNPIGEPYNLLVMLNDDTLPSPDALMVTGISPQKTLEEGYSEAQFAKLLQEEIFTEDTIAVGFNNVRFDDEFLRHLFWRTFYDPYAWTWRDGRSRWDMLDVVRMTRALRPEGITWPIDATGKPTNRLELITAQNGISHSHAHDALADVEALIDVARLIRSIQPHLFGYLLSMRDKKAVQALVNLDDKRPFVYVSGRYDAEWQKATVAFPLTVAPNHNVVVYDLRHDPTQFLDLDEAELSAKAFASWEDRTREGFVGVPTKILQYNRCPAVAPLSVLEMGQGWKKLGLDKETVQRHMNILLARPDFAEKLRGVFEKRKDYAAETDPEARLYDGFLADRDVLRAETVRRASENELADLHPDFTDERLVPLLLHYKARNFPRSLSETEAVRWEEWRAGRLARQLPSFMSSLARLTKTASEHQRFMLQQLHLWVEAVLPADTD
jgi:exodeoxyribonuclease-1